MINALRQGDEFAFEQVYAQHCNQVFAYFKKKVRTNEDAQDMMQITFLKLWQYRGSLSENYLLEQHLFHIARTVFIDYLRKQNKIAHLQGEILAKAKDAQTDHFVPSFSTASDISVVLSSMPDIRRKVFELNRLHGYSYKEVAALLSISVKAVDNNLTKALKQLRAQFIISLILVFCSHF